MREPGIEDIANVTGLIYEAAYSGRRWDEAIESIRLLFGGSRACIVRFDKTTVDAICTLHDPGFTTPESLRAFRDDPLGLAVTKIPVGQVCRTFDLVDEKTFLRGELWQDWFRPRDMYDGMVCNLLVSDGLQWAIDIQRGQKQASFDIAEVGLMKMLAPHLLRASEIERRFGHNVAAGRSLLNSPFALMLVDAEGRLIEVNDAAGVLLADAESPLDVKAGRLETVNRDEQEVLLCLVASACRTREGMLSGTGGAMSLTGSEAVRPGKLAISIAPFVNSGLYGLSGPRYALVIAREIAPSLPEGFEEHIRAVFKLTACEASLAAALASGLSLKEAAASAGIRFGTVRGYLIRVFRKTGTTQQSQLVALLKSMQPFPQPGSS